MSRAFVAALAKEIDGKLRDLQDRVMGGQLSHDQYVRLTAQAEGIQWALNKATELLTRDADEDEE